MTTYRKKLIEVALPLAEINDASAYDKMPGIGPHPKGIHQWWARLPLPTGRAVLFASVVDDPSAHPEKFPTEEAQNAERERLFDLLRQLMQKKMHEHPEVYAAARAEMLKHCGGKLPPVLDPFAGGGSIPLEAARLGFEAHAADLNPVAVLLNKCNLELVPRWLDQAPVNPEAAFLGTRASRPHLSETPASRPHKEWHSRGYLPHFDHPGLVQFITFRLADSMPVEVLHRWGQELSLSPGMAADDPRMVELRKRVEKYEDAGHGSCLLRGDPAARIVQDALLHFDGQRYRLLAWCIMPNHVHVLIETFEGHRLGDIIHSWKSYTAKVINEQLGRAGALWMPDYYDRFIRHEEHFRAAVEYIENNPVKAGLVDAPQHWEWSHVSMGRTAGGTPAVPGMWRGARGLAEDVRYYGRIIRQRAIQKIGHLYPKVRLPKQYGGREANVIAWLWARTVASPNPAAKGAHVPMVSTFWLSSKKGTLAWLEPVVDRRNNTWRFEVRTGEPPDRNAIRQGTKLGRGAFRCLLSDSPIEYSYLRDQATRKRLSRALVCIVAETERGRIYLDADRGHEQIAEVPLPYWRPEERVTAPCHDVDRLPMYGMPTWADAFTPRQFTALVTFSDLVREVRQDVLKDAGNAGVPPAEAGEYAKAVATFLGLTLGRLADLSNSLCGWDSTNTRIAHLFGRQAIPMVWDFAESNSIGTAIGSWESCVERVVECIEVIPAGQTRGGRVRQLDAASSWDDLQSILVSTDPPYYDNIGYAALSDFFYVWLRRTLGDLYPDLFKTILVPKTPELTAAPERFDGDKGKAREHFESGFRKAFAALRQDMDPVFPLTVYYAFKQEDEDLREDEGEQRASNGVDRTTGWETLLEALLGSGFQITATWPVRASLKWRMVAMGTNALASYIVLACRARPADAPQCSRREFLGELKKDLPAALKHLQQGNIAPVDLAQASIGPG
ncbi:MAG: DUF1156 domain-containing protein, partial [Planctomycetes bacterium]|nr:DUF1156 domain-containing protein [Planctomycetota bacterium]